MENEPLDNPFTFLAPGELLDGDLRLVLEATVIDTSGDEPLPTYRLGFTRFKGFEP